MDNSFPDIEGIDINAAIKASLCSYEDYMDILKIYYRTLNTKSEKIKQAYETNDTDNYIIYVHGLKSSSRVVGAYQLGDMAYELELAGKAGNIDIITQKTNILLDNINKLYNNLSLVFESGIYDANTISEEELESMLTDLREYMYNNDIILVNDIIEQLESVYINETTAQLIDSISSLSLQMEYGQCIELIDSFLL